MQRDYHNNDLVAEVCHFVMENLPEKVTMTDLEWLDKVASIVNQRKLTWDTVDCHTGLSYVRGK